MAPRGDEWLRARAIACCGVRAWSLLPPATYPPSAASRSSRVSRVRAVHEPSPGLWTLPCDGSDCDYGGCAHAVHDGWTLCGAHSRARVRLRLHLRLRPRARTRPRPQHRAHQLSISLARSRPRERATRHLARRMHERRGRCLSARWPTQWCDSGLAPRRLGHDVERARPRHNARPARPAWTTLRPPHAWSREAASSEVAATGETRPHARTARSARNAETPRPKARTRGVTRVALSARWRRAERTHPSAARPSRPGHHWAFPPSRATLRKRALASSFFHPHTRFAYCALSLFMSRALDLPASFLPSAGAPSRPHTRRRDDYVRVAPVHRPSPAAPAPP